MGRQLTATEEDIERWEKAQRSGAAAKAGRLLCEDGMPSATIVQLEANGVIEPHSHSEDQWQIILEGSCTVGGEYLEPHGVHYTDANTPYGPIVAGDDGVTFLVLRDDHPAAYHPVDQ